MITRLSLSGLSPRLFAIAGIDTAIIVASSPSMKKAHPTTSGTRMRSRGLLLAADAVAIEVGGGGGDGAPGSLIANGTLMVSEVFAGAIIADNAVVGTEGGVAYANDV